MYKNNKILKENIEKFLYSDNASATATKFILATLGVGGIALGGAAIPGLIRVIKDLEYSPDYTDEKVRNAFYALKRRKFVKIVKSKDGKIKVKLTNKGKRRLAEFTVDSIRIDASKKWDGKWRILIFDIPVKLNNARTALRRKIQELGFYQFQGSVWFYPYPCEDEILAIAEFFEVSEYIEIVTAERVLHKKELKKHFKIK